jgi:hypothetical protein
VRVATRIWRLPHPRCDETLQAQRFAFAGWLARLYSGKAAGFDEPLLAGRKLPPPLHGQARIPAHRLVLDVHDLVMGVEQLDAMPVGIAHVDEERVPRTVPAGTKLDVRGKTHLRGEIADIEEVIGFRDGERGMMQPRPFCTSGTSSWK